MFFRWQPMVREPLVSPPATADNYVQWPLHVLYKRATEKKTMFAATIQCPWTRHNHSAASASVAKFAPMTSHFAQAGLPHDLQCLEQTGTLSVGQETMIDCSKQGVQPLARVPVKLAARIALLPSSGSRPTQGSKVSEGASFSNGLLTRRGPTNTLLIATLFNH